MPNCLLYSLSNIVLNTQIQSNDSVKSVGRRKDTVCLNSQSKNERNNKDKKEPCLEASYTMSINYV